MSKKLSKKAGEFHPVFKKGTKDGQAKGAFGKSTNNSRLRDWNRSANEANSLAYARKINKLNFSEVSFV